MAESTEALRGATSCHPGRQRAGGRADRGSHRGPPILAGGKGGTRTEGGPHLCLAAPYAWQHGPLNQPTSMLPLTHVKSCA